MIFMLVHLPNLHSARCASARADFRNMTFSVKFEVKTAYLELSVDLI
jgi:hypothetical protein